MTIRNVALAAAVALFTALIAVSPRSASAALVPEDLSGPLAPADLASTLVGGGISVSNVTYSGADVAAGRFSGGTGIIGFESGIVLSSGNLVDIVGPNTADDSGVDNTTAGDADLAALVGTSTFDAAVLEFDFTPAASTVVFRYVFASEEYNEYVFAVYNDVFAFFVNGTNCATVAGGQPVSINTINNGNNFDGVNAQNPSLYINNDLDNGGGTIDTELDGLTTVLTCQAAVNAGVSNHVKLAIADASDEILDSAVFLEADSFVAPTPTASPAPTASAAPTPSPAAPIAPVQLPDTGGPADGGPPASLIALAGAFVAAMAAVVIGIRRGRAAADS